jgi:hypothetical protein
MKAKLRGVLGAAGAVLLGHATAHAQNYREVPIGGRTATMGGAGTAAGNDSAMPLLNPAGMAGVPGGVFAVSASVYAFTQRSIPAYFAPTGFPPALGPYILQTDHVSSQSVANLPSSVMYFKNVSPPEAAWHQVLGLALIIPQTPTVQIQASLRASFPQGPATIAEDDTVTTTSTTYYFGPTYAAAYHDRVRLGLSAHVAYQQIFNATSTTFNASINRGTDTLQGLQSAGASGSSFAFAPTIGAQVRVAPRLWIGAAFQPPGLPLTGSFNSSATNSTVATAANGAPANVSSQQTASGVFHYAPPMHVNVGLAYDDRDRFSAAIDGHVYFARADAFHQAGTDRTQVTQSGEIARDATTAFVSNNAVNAVFDVSVGVEYVLNKLLAARLGAFTDMAADPSLENPQQSDALSLREDRYGVTAGLGLTLGPFDTTLGVVYVRGVGRYVTTDVSQLTSSEVKTVDEASNTLVFVLSGAVTTEQAQETIQKALPFKLPEFLTPASPPPLLPSPPPAEPEPEPEPIKNELPPKVPGP